MVEGRRWGRAVRGSIGADRRWAHGVPRLRPALAVPQCGFASTEEGNILAEHQQWAKLRLITEIAEEIWG